LPTPSFRQRFPLFSPLPGQPVIIIEDPNTAPAQVEVIDEKPIDDSAIDEDSGTILPALSLGEKEPEESFFDKESTEEEEEKAPEAISLGNSQLDSYLEKLQTQKKILDLVNSVAKARLQQDLMGRNGELEKLKLTVQEMKLKQEFAESTAKAEISEEIIKLKRDNELLTVENALSKAKTEKALSDIKAKETQMMSEINQLNLQVQQREKEFIANNYTKEEPSYLVNPLQGKQLSISDRRVELNGMITMKKAEEITDRIHYFNNKSPEYPIFIVIDSSPGGSVMAGYRILKAMEGSTAPVHVVLKSFAASMSAVIVAMAEESYAYPNALIMHHQLMAMGFGNLTEQKEFVETMEDWWKRLATPVAQKMGISIDEFIEKMYKNNSTGNWEEFGDKARELKWVNHIVEEIRETSVQRNPDYKPPTLLSRLRKSLPSRTSSNAEEATEQYQIIESSSELTEMVDVRGRPYMKLPRLDPYDAWWIYNPDQYYRSY